MFRQALVGLLLYLTIVDVSRLGRAAYPNVVNMSGLGPAGFRILVDVDHLSCAICLAVVDVSRLKFAATYQHEHDKAMDLHGHLRYGSLTYTNEWVNSSPCLLSISLCSNLSLQIYENLYSSGHM